MLQIILLSLGLSCVTGMLSLAASKARPVSKVIACAGGMGAAVLSFIGGVGALFQTATYVSWAGPLPFANFTLLLNPLAGLFIAVIAALAFAAWLYGLAYFDEYYEAGIGPIGFFMNLFIASMNLVILADNAFWFLVFFELMSLTSYMLVIVDQTEKSLRGGFLYLIMAHIGFLMIALSFFSMAVCAGSLEFAAFRGLAFVPPVATIAFVLAFFGFGAKAGVVPFHSWLPQAHPAAPSNVSALMSGGMIKIGIFGICKVCFDLLGATGGEVSWGVLVIIIGAVSSVLGVVYALGEHDLKSLLAYHSVENIGIILLGVGTGIFGWAAGLPWLAAIGLLAGLYHVVNHAMFKGLLFLGAGSVLHATGTRNMEVLGGLARVMPWTAVCFLIGSLAISAIPPLNGFVSEWFTYQGLIGAAMGGDVFLRIVFAFAVVALAITGALAVTCFVKAFGVTFLARPRSKAAERAHEAPVPMVAAMVMLTAACIALGLGAAWVAPQMSDLAASVLAAPALPVGEGAVLVSLDTVSVVSPLVIAVLMVAVIGGCTLARNAANRRAGIKDDPQTWACGYAADLSMETLASTVGANVKGFMGPLYAIRRVVNGLGAVLARMVSRGLSLEKESGVCAPSNADPDSRYDRDRVAGIAPAPAPTVPLSHSVLSIVSDLGAAFARLESGDFRTYIVYIVGALVFFLALIILVR
ncbi:hydrogenase 4 subunit B [Parvibacter caecicola]|uniref:Hydrogenase-4 component B n=1 Tax=Parvibacter caecicola TaxID=747645 RepID=A0A7W5D3C8_9ACTN|nr:hydrogenase 4 subunit B [Parvibacter caecicola]MBB3172174.1 hydrogenase-4 component B [Parvibacter caecicola]MCR2041922.1 hydrogenase 4 subunit B [Parvibacter caecicola]RNL09607.1 hydrogenase 4 subunit B [Parvibacter caecicola]